MRTHEFIPTTAARAIGDGVFFRPVRSWHSGTYAGEGLHKLPETYDRSGCLFPEKIGGLPVSSPPMTVTHRLYWHEAVPTKTISAFLSYPDAMAAVDQYFWEALGIESDDVTRFLGEGAEERMESAIRRRLLAGVPIAVTDDERGE